MAPYSNTYTSKEAAVDFLHVIRVLTSTVGHHVLSEAFNRSHVTGGIKPPKTASRRARSAELFEHIHHWMADKLLEARKTVCKSVDTSLDRDKTSSM